MNEEFNFDPSSIERFRNNLEERYKENEKRLFRIGFTGEARSGKTTYMNLLFSQKNLIIPDLPNFNSIADSDEKKLNLQKLLQAKSEIRNLKKETQEIDKKINDFFEWLKEIEKVRQEGLFNFLGIAIIESCYLRHHAHDIISKTLLSEILEIQEKNKKLLACITKLEATLQAVMLMWLVTSIKQIPSFIVYLICNLNVTIVEWLRSGLGEEMMGDLAERHHELKQEHPNSNVLVSFILLSTVLQMLWSVLLIKLSDLMSDEEINLGVSFSFV